MKPIGKRHPGFVARALGEVAAFIIEALIDIVGAVL
jgi:hypothetical protein